MNVSFAESACIREKWIAARKAKRQSHSQIERAKSQIERGKLNENALLLRQSTFDEILSRGVMQRMANQRLQLRRR